jgi:lysozyme
VNYLDILHAQLRIDEGYRTKLYVDSVGKISCGIGRNLSDVGVNRGEIALMFDNDLVAAERIARSFIPVFDQLSDVRKAVVVNMAFNLGSRLAAFTNTLKAINQERWTDAAAEMLHSNWSGQVGARALRLSYSMGADAWKEP